MAGNRKNNHYHYAEQFEDRRRHARSGRTAYVPFKALVISLVVLLMFGLVSTTFATYISENEPEYNPDGEQSLALTVRNIKASRDVALTGANVDLAESGGNVTGGYVVFEAPSNWDTSTYSHVQYVLYQNNYSWISSDMTHIANTNYWYCSDANPAHGTWNHEQIMFIANDSSWGTYGGDVSDNSDCYYRTAKVTQAMSSGYYLFTGGGTSNPYTNSYTRNNTTLSDAIGVYNQTAEVYTSTNGTSYSSSGTGGQVKIKASWLDISNNQAAETEKDYSNGDTTWTYENAVAHTAVTYTASANSGYRFVGWFSSTSATTAASTAASYTYTNSLTGTKTLYARFIKRNTVTVAKNPTAYTGSPTAGGSTSSTTVDAGTGVQLIADVKTGVDFDGWTFNNSSYSFTSGSASDTTCTIKPTANVTATANYSLQKPTSLSLSYPTIVAGSTSSPTKSATSPSSGSLSYSYSIAPSSGTTAASSTYSVNSSGVVSASVPGKYTVTMSVTTTAYGLTSAASTKTAEVTVKPTAPSSSLLSYTVEGYTDDYAAGTTGVSYSTPIKVPIRSTSFKITAWLTSTVQGYTYDWSNISGTYNTSNGTISAISGAVTKTAQDYRVVDLCSDSGSALIVNSDGNYAYQISVTATYNGVSSDATSMTLYYDVISDFLDIQYISFTADTNDYQKIYAEDNGIDSIVSTIRAGGTTFNTISWFSPDNIKQQILELWASTVPFTNSYGTFNSVVPNDAAHSTSDLQDTFDLSGTMEVTGPKWYRIYMNDTGNQKTASATKYIHTTVGTSSTVANRPIYYLDDTGITHTNSRVMAFFMKSGDATPTVRYQTAQTITRTVNGTAVTYYRFYIPSDATQVTFAHVADNSYVLPTWDSTNSTLNYPTYTDNNALKAWTATVDLTAAANTDKTVYEATAATQDSSTGIYNYTGSMTTLD